MIDERSKRQERGFEDALLLSLARAVSGKEDAQSKDVSRGLIHHRQKQELKELRRLFSLSLAGMNPIARNQGKQTRNNSVCIHNWESVYGHMLKGFSIVMTVSRLYHYDGWKHIFIFDERTLSLNTILSAIFVTWLLPLFLSFDRARMPTVFSP